MKIKTFKNGLIRIHGKIGSIEMNQNYIGLTMEEAIEHFIVEGMRRNEVAKLLETKEPILYQLGPGGKRITIPQGTPVFPADNLPEGGYWCMPWEGMNEYEESWHRNYGFWVSKAETDMALPF